MNSFPFLSTYSVVRPTNAEMLHAGKISSFSTHLIVFFSFFYSLESKFAIIFFCPPSFVPPVVYKENKLEKERGGGNMNNIYLTDQRLVFMWYRELNKVIWLISL